MTELLLMVFGGIIFTVSFFLPAGRKKDNGALDGAGGEQIKEMINKEVAEAKSQINEIVDETITYTMEKTERSMERLTNEKMMAVNEFSDTVLEQINKNHKEAVFLYDRRWTLVIYSHNVTIITQKPPLCKGGFVIFQRLNSSPHREKIIPFQCPPNATISAISSGFASAGIS